MPFWTAAGATGQDPKRESRFKVSIDSLNTTEGIVWYAKTFSKPQATVKGVKHRYLNHQFSYPGSVEWADCTVEFIDPTDPIDAAGSIAQLLELMGYQIPKDGSEPQLINISKRKSVNSLGSVSVSSINDEGEIIETWTLQQPWVTKFEWGSYKYEGDALLSLKLKFTYDWATCEIKNPGVDKVDPAEPLSQETAAKKGKFFNNS